MCFRSNYPIWNTFVQWLVWEKACQAMTRVFRLIGQSLMMSQQLKVNEKNINITLFACLSLGRSLFLACVWQTRIRVVVLVLFFFQNRKKNVFFSVVQLFLFTREKEKEKSPKHVHQNHNNCMRFLQGRTIESIREGVNCLLNPLVGIIGTTSKKKINISFSLCPSPIRLESAYLQFFF